MAKVDRGMASDNRDQCRRARPASERAAEYYPWQLIARAMTSLELTKQSSYQT